MQFLTMSPNPPDRDFSRSTLMQPLFALRLLPHNIQMRARHLRPKVGGSAAAAHRVAGAATGTTTGSITAAAPAKSVAGGGIGATGAGAGAGAGA